MTSYLRSLPPHPHLPRVLGVCLEKDHPAIVFDLIEGWNLGEFLVGVGGKLQYTCFVLHCAIQVASALCFLHEKGIVHRDVALRYAVPVAVSCILLLLF